jgi:hypothetical protein
LFGLAGWRPGSAAPLPPASRGSLHLLHLHGGGPIPLLAAALEPGRQRVRVQVRLLPQLLVLLVLLLVEVR